MKLVRQRANTADPSTRFVAAIGLAISLAMASALPASAGEKLTKDEKRYLDTIFDDRNLAKVDYSNVGDAELVAAGRAICSSLKILKGEGTREGTGGPTPDDFDTVAQDVAASRFAEVTKDILGRPLANGKVLLAYSVGIASVKKLCPKYRGALG